MKTSELFALLEKHREKSLLFEYAPGLLVGANYHITEIKHVKIDSVDCGAGTGSWNEMVVQLLESPKRSGEEEYLSWLKAWEIFKKAGEMKAYDSEAEVKFEYGNNSFHTAQLHVNTTEATKDQLLLKLKVEATDCKAKEACGIERPAEAEKEAAACCSPGTGCC